jgi:acyl-CoA thioester hydrolase
LSAPFTIVRRVQFAETDMAGVVHFANFFRYMEEAEHAFWRSIGESVHSGGANEVVGWPRASASCDYLSPLRFDDEVTLSVTISELGGKSVTFEIDFTCAGKRVARGRTRAVYCRIEAGRFESTPIPAELRAKLASFSKSN